jgi:hypothetical protein
MERRVIKWTDRERSLVGKIENHLRRMAERNARLLNKHVRRTASLSLAMAVKQDMPERDCFITAEFGLKHDLGKNDAQARAWIERNRGQRVTEQERVEFRVYHSVMGIQFVPQFDRTEAVTDPEQDNLICLHHHDRYLDLKGVFRQHIAIVQTADSFDAMISTEDEHSFARFNEADAIRELYSRTSLGELDFGSVNTLAFCRGLVS